MKDMAEEFENKDLEEYLDRIGIPKNKTSLKEIVSTIAYSQEKRETIFIDQNGKEIDSKNIIKEDSYDKNFSFFKKGSLLTARSHYTQVLVSDSQGDIPKKSAKTEKDYVNYDLNHVESISLQCSQQITVLEEGFLKVADGSKEAYGLMDIIKKIHREKPTSTLTLRYIKCLTLGNKERWFDAEIEKPTKPLILYIFFNKDITKNFLTSLLFDSTLEVEQKEEDLYQLKEINYKDILCLYSTGFRFI